MNFVFVDLPILHFSLCSQGKIINSIKCEVVPEVDVGAIDIFSNLTNSRTQLMNKDVPSRGSREKESKITSNFY